MLVVVGLVALLAGCSSTSHTAAAPFYRATATVRSAGGLVHHEVIWYRSSDGAFRVTRIQSGDTHLPHVPTLTVYDGTNATAAFPVAKGVRSAIEFSGSRRFVTTAAGVAALPMLVKYVDRHPGTAAASFHGRAGGQTVAATVKPVSSAPAAGTFRPPSNVKVQSVSTEFRPSADPKLHFPTYWLGASFDGEPATGASSETHGGKASYQVSYPGLTLIESRPRNQPPTTQRQVTAGGQTFNVHVATADERGDLTFGWSTGGNTLATGGSVSVGGFIFTDPASKPGDQALMLTGPHTEILIMGHEVKGHVDAILAALRPT